MKKQIVRDERVSAEKRKIGSDTCILLMLVLLGSILVQQYIYDAPFEQYAVEFICFTGASIYLLVRSFLRGINMFSGKHSFKIQVVLNSAVFALALTAFNGTFRYINYEEHFRDNLGNFAITLAITFLSSMAINFAVLYFIYQINNKRQKQIEETFNDDSVDE